MILLIIPWIIQIEYNFKVSFSFLYVIIFSGSIILIFTRYYDLISKISIQIFNRFSLNKFKLEIIPGKNIFSRLQFKNPFNEATFKLYADSLFQFLKLYIKASFFLIIGILFYRVFFHWQLNQGIDRLYWFLVSEFLDILEMIFSISPYLLAILLPFTIYYFNSKGFWLNVALHKRNEKTLIALMIIFSIFFLLLNFSIRENYAYHWKELAKEIYADKVLRFNQEKVGTKSLSYRRFLRLENNIILFYFHASKTKGIYKLFDIVYNDEKNYHLITASEVTVKKNRLFMKNGYVHDLSKTSIDTEKFC